MHLEGKPGEIGFQHGSLLSAEIKDTFKAVSTEMVHEEKKDWEFFRKAAEQVFWPHVEPQYREELNGIVEGLQVQGREAGHLGSGGAQRLARTALLR